MNKMNKKGFTLIEMLVVIAIIAVLVSIIIPIVGNSTEKAQCATNAANLRSVKAEIITQLLTDLITEDQAESYDVSDVKFYDVDNKGTDFVCTVDDTTGDVTVTLGGLTVQEWANLAS